MAKQVINIGAAPQDNTGDPLRTAMEKINSNFDELYGVKKTIVYLTNSVPIPHNTGTVVNWEQAIDEVGAWDIQAPERITAPAGVTGCQVLIHAEWAINGVGYRSIRYRAGQLGDSVAVARNVGSGDPFYSISNVIPVGNGVISDHHGSCSLRMNCAEGDWFEMLFRQYSGADLDVIPPATYMAVNWFYD